MSEYVIDFVYENINESLSKEIINLWVENKAIPLEEAQRRTKEVACVGRNQEGQLVGVSSVYLQEIPNYGGVYYIYRQFTRLSDRRLILSQRLLRKTLTSLGELKTNTKGVILVTENIKLLRRSGFRIFERSGMQHVGKNELGQDIWKIDFLDTSS
jgi:hypothetical protein